MYFRKTKTHIEFRFDPADYATYKKGTIQLFVFELKNSVPENKRNYIAEKKLWQVNNEHVKTFNLLYSKHFTKQGNLFEGG